MHRGLMGAAQHWVGEAKARWGGGGANSGGGGGGGSTKGGCQPLRTAPHTISISISLQDNLS